MSSPTDSFPVESFREAAIHLRRPFTPQAVKFKVQATWASGGLIVGYIDARLVVERLNLIVPHLWHDAYRPIGASQMWCDLTVDGITRSDVGEGAGKGLVSDALKRAAVKFGVGVPLYAVPSMILNNQHLDRKQKGQKESVTITPTGDVVVRDAYRRWLEEHGEKAFGAPLDHGDSEGAQGDHETMVDEPPSDVTPAPRITPEAAANLLLNADSADIARGDLHRAVEHVCGRGTPALQPDAAALLVLEGLNPEQGARLDAWIERKRIAANPDPTPHEPFSIEEAEA